MRRLVIPVIVVLLAIALPAGAASAKDQAIKPLLTQVAAQGETDTGGGTDARLLATEVDVFEPSGEPSQVVEGSCWTGSVAVPRTDAWRCMVDNAILDPCFGSQDATAVICVRSPLDASDSVQINLTEPLPQAQEPVEARPWFLELADGTTCAPLTGTLPPVPGERVIYGCSDGSYIQGLPHVDLVWTAHRIWISPPTPDGGSAIVAAELADIKTVWF